MARFEKVIEDGEVAAAEGMKNFLKSEHNTHVLGLYDLPQDFELSSETDSYPYPELFKELAPIFCQTWPPQSEDAAVAIIQQQNRAGEDRATIGKVYVPKGVSPDKLLVILDRALTGMASSLKYEVGGCPYTVLLHTGRDPQGGATFCLGHNGDTYAVEINGSEVTRLTPWETAQNIRVKADYEQQTLQATAERMRIGAQIGYYSAEIDKAKQAIKALQYKMYREGEQVATLVQSDLLEAGDVEKALQELSVLQKEYMDDADKERALMELIKQKSSELPKLEKKYSDLKKQPVLGVANDRICEDINDQYSHFLQPNGGFGDTNWNRNTPYRRLPYVGRGVASGKVFMATDGYDDLMNPKFRKALFAGLQADEASLLRLHQQHAQIYMADVTDGPKAAEALRYKDDATAIVIDGDKLPAPTKLSAAGKPVTDDEANYSVTELGLYAVFDGHGGDIVMRNELVSAVYLPDGEVHKIKGKKQCIPANHAAKFLSRYVQQQILLEKYQAFYDKLSAAIEAGNSLEGVNEEYAEIAQEIEGSPLHDFNLLDCLAPGKVASEYDAVWRTPLQFAIYHGNMSAALWLLENGATTDAPGVGPAGGMNAQQYADWVFLTALSERDKQAPEESAPKISCAKQVCVLLILFEGCLRTLESCHGDSSPLASICARRELHNSQWACVAPKDRLAFTELATLQVKDMQALLDQGVFDSGFVDLVIEASANGMNSLSGVLNQVPSYAEYIEPGSEAEFDSGAELASSEEEMDVHAESTEGHVVEMPAQGQPAGQGRHAINLHGTFARPYVPQPVGTSMATNVQIGFAKR